MRRDEILKAWREGLITGREAMEMTGFENLDDLDAEADRRLDAGRAGRSTRRRLQVNNEGQAGRGVSR